ncbi:hypothetical protein FIBSPDRAFT_1051075 [Athelia psychrophila]|uniref:Uncharacterized protein n=1 Tax=Athelia psychrophila TaxID=1759441 RepID=A0A165ZRF9_9AGAM|nr:hypothetical protein FIBSPDRAFT_1051075 [Fibularhizoctonia sp. CBS 109695]
MCIGLLSRTLKAGESVCILALHLASGRRRYGGTALTLGAAQYKSDCSRQRSMQAQSCLSAPSLFGRRDPSWYSTPPSYMGPSCTCSCY